LAGKVFVVTGVLESIERDDAVDLIKRYGGKVTQAVSKKTSFVVVGRDPGMSKMEKVRLNNQVWMIDESELISTVYHIFRQSRLGPNRSTRMVYLR
jgi:replication factor C subunit 1